MRKLFPSEKKVLERLIFTEPYEVLLDETGLPIGALRDDLINLINYRLIEVVYNWNDQINTTSFYDADNLQDFSFRATKQIETTKRITQIYIEFADKSLDINVDAESSTYNIDETSKHYVLPKIMVVSCCAGEQNYIE